MKSGVSKESQSLKDRVKTNLTVSGGGVIYDLNKLDPRIKRLPYSLRILLESVLRNLDGHIYTAEHLESLLNWNPAQSSEFEIPFMPARVVLQDFTGVPAVVDLAAMRDAIKELKGSPELINPLVPCDLVIDHSVQVDSYGSSQALSINEKLEFDRNAERYRLLKWAQKAFSNFRVVPPATGIVHQVNLEYLASVVSRNKDTGICAPDSCVGTDSHTTMTNGLGVLSWGVGGIEAEAVMLGQPVYMLVPDVVGINLVGKLPVGATATDAVLVITELCRQVGVVGKFVEFFGEGVASLSLADRATIANMAPEQGSTVSFFGVDNETLRYLRHTGRREEDVNLVEAYWKAQAMFACAGQEEIEYSKVISLDLAAIEPSVAGPKRPQDRVGIKAVKEEFNKALVSPIGNKGFGVDSAQLQKTEEVVYSDGFKERLTHGSVVLAAITSCTNTSNPRVMLGAGILARKAVARGLKVPRHVKTSLAPGSKVVTEYLQKSGLLAPLESLGFFVVGYGCTTCIGNSGPLGEEVSKAITQGELVVSAVLSGNRNFEGRVSPLTRANYLASPPLVVAYALAGTVQKNIFEEPLGYDQAGAPVFLHELWPTVEELQEALMFVENPELYKGVYAQISEGSEAWRAIESEDSLLYPWSEQSTYIQSPPFFDAIKDTSVIRPIENARVLALFGDSITTDHISPAGSIAKDSPAGKFLDMSGVPRAEWNSYGSRRGNHLVMVRGTFANTRIRNLLVPGKEGNVTVYFPENEMMSIYEASQRYEFQGIPLIVIAGKEYGSGSSRDWAAKGPQLLGVKAVIAQSFERIHRSNLIGMGILPLQFEAGQSAESLGLTGREVFDIDVPVELEPGGWVFAKAVLGESVREFKVKCRIDTPVEIDYYRSGGILNYVLRNLL